MRRRFFGAVLTRLAVLSLIGAGAGAALLASDSASAAPTSSTFTVTGSGQSGWIDFQQCYDNSGNPTTTVDPSNTVKYVPGPGSPPLGTGSVQLSTGNGTTAGDCQASVRNVDYAGTALSALTTLSYYAYSSQNNGQQFPVLSLDVNNEGDSSGPVDDTLFFEPPYQQPTTGDPIPSPVSGGCPDQGATATDTWQQWNALTGCWWDNGVDGGTPVLGSGGLGSVSPLSTYLASYPGAVIVNPASNEGGVRFFVGEASPSDQFVGNVDDAVIGTSSATNTYNFEPATTLYVAPGGSNVNTNTSCQDAIYSDIQTAVTDAAPGATIDVCPGTYQDYVTIPSSKTGLTLKGIATSNGNPPVIVFPTTANPYASTLKADPLVDVNGATGVTIEDLEVSGPYYDTGCEANTASSPSHYGIYVGASGSATITSDYVEEIRSKPSENLNGCQDGFGVGVGNAGGSDTGTATIENNLIQDYQKVGVRVDNGSTATVTGNTVQGVGPTNVIASNGVEMLTGATGSVANNTVSGNQYTPPSFQGTGILLYGSAGVNVQDNTLSANDLGIYVGIPSAAVTVQGNHVTNDTTNADSEGIQLDGCAGNGSTTTCGTGPTVKSNTVSSGYVGIDVFDGTTGAAIQSNTVTGAGDDGILDQGATAETAASNYGIPVAASTGNTFTSNSASGSTNEDCQDYTSGGGTASTGNTWTTNTGTKASPTAICTTATTAGTVLYAVNAGGPAVTGSPSWTADTSASPSTFNNAISTGNNNTYGTTATINTNGTGVPAAVFQASRYDLKTSPDLTWSFPETTGTNVTVRLDFAELYPPLFKVGGRTFDVYIDGTKVLSKFDIYATAGAGDKGIVESFPATSTGGHVTITFDHEVQEPTINGIEILSR